MEHLCNQGLRQSGKLNLGTRDNKTTILPEESSKSSNQYLLQNFAYEKGVLFVIVIVSIILPLIF
jgi:hypothetical protein